MTKEISAVSVPSVAAKNIFSTESSITKGLWNAVEVKIKKDLIVEQLFSKHAAEKKTMRKGLHLFRRYYKPLISSGIKLY